MALEKPRVDVLVHGKAFAPGGRAAEKVLVSLRVADVFKELQVSGGATMEKVKQFGGQTPLGRPGQPAELASIYVQLAANDASYSTGQVYGAMGGGGLP